MIVRMKYFNSYIKNNKNIYNKIKSIRCEALFGELVFFDENGSRHLTRKGVIMRPISEQKRRFGLLKYCKDILEDKDVEVEYRISEIGNSKAEFWGISKTINSKKVKIVIRRINNGKLIFLSIMDYLK